MTKDGIYNLLIILLSLGVITVALFKFILITEPGIVRVEDVDHIRLRDASENTLKLYPLLNGELDNYILLFEMDNCGSCIYKGLKELEFFQKKGNNCIAIMIHDRPSELSGWSDNYDFHPIYFISRSGFYEYFDCQQLPVMFRISGEKIEIIRYFTI